LFSYGIYQTIEFSFYLISKINCIFTELKSYRARAEFNDEIFIASSKTSESAKKQRGRRGEDLKFLEKPVKRKRMRRKKENEKEGKKEGRKEKRRAPSELR